MIDFIDKNWLIRNEIGKHLFHEVASEMPIIDYHNHLNPHHIADNKQYSNLTELWINEDPYKHRAMRIMGIPEKGISGDGLDFEKYENWVNTFSKTIGNPLFHWSCLELKRIFGINEVLNKDNAEKIWNTCNQMLQQEGFRTRDIIKSYHVEILVTSDDLLDKLHSHQVIKNSQSELKVFPSLRSDSILNVEDSCYLDWIKNLSALTHIPIKGLGDLMTCIVKRLDYFGENGCSFADHAIDSGFKYLPVSETEASFLFEKVINMQELGPKELIKLRSFLLLFLGQEYGKRGWFMQLHIGAQRKTSSRLRQLAGPSGGFASIGKACDINSLTLFLDGLEKNGRLPETILYTLNPADNAVLASLTGSYSEDGICGKIQFGPAWWYNDHYVGIKKHLNDISSYGLVSTFIGMTTDSRSILSLSRHEYFRRILCDLLGIWASEGKIPNDINVLQQMVKDISYFNIRNKILKMEKTWLV